MRLIDADALLKDIRDHSQSYFADDFAEEWVDRQPTIYPEPPKTGKWLSHYDYCKKHGYTPSGLIVYWWCDQCEQGVEHPTKFCPNCGVRMEAITDDTTGG